MTVQVEAEKYEGSGASKKMAKHACARAALTKLYNMSFTPHMTAGYFTFSYSSEILKTIFRVAPRKNTVHMTDI